MPLGNESRRRTFMKGAGAVGVAGLLAGCSALTESNDGGNGDGAATGSQELPEITMTIGHGDPPDPMTQTHAVSTQLKEFMERNTDGKFTVEINPGGSLGTYTEMIEQVIGGSLEMTIPAEGHLAPIYPNINVYALPYAFRDPLHALHVMDNQFGDELRQDMIDESGLRMLGWWENGGMRNFFVNTEQASTELRQPSDLEGLKFRTMEIQAHMAIVEALGAQAEPIAWTELYNAIEQGVVDGAELPIPVYMIPNLWEVTDWMIMDRHVYSMAMAITNNEWFRDLPAEYQRLLGEGMQLGAMQGRRIGALLRRRGRGFIENEGVTVYEPSPEALAEFRSLTQDSVEEMVRDQVEDEGMVDDLKEAIGDSAERLQYPTGDN